MIIEKYLETAQARRDMYAFLSSVYLTEQTQESLERLATLRFASDEGSPAYRKGCEGLDAYLGRLPFRARQDLAVDYARVFAAAGIPQGSAAFPYESVYTSSDHLVMQDACTEVRNEYRAKGLAVHDSVEPPDHIAFELEFMARLVDEGISAAKDCEESGTRIAATEQADFLVSHLLNWVPCFVRDVQKHARTEFYQSIAFITLGFLEMDHEELQAMLEF